VPLLELKDVRAGYGDAVVLDGISLCVPDNGSLAVLGRNGVGKSTLLLTIMGMTRVSRGEILFKNENISSLPAHQRARLGWAGWRRSARSSPPSASRRT
jgi:branched-chain amino acid transport system ATP-binding protein